MSADPAIPRQPSNLSQVMTIGDISGPSSPSTISSFESNRSSHCASPTDKLTSSSSKRWRNWTFSKRSDDHVDVTRGDNEDESVSPGTKSSFFTSAFNTSTSSFFLAQASQATAQRPKLARKKSSFLLNLPKISASSSPCETPPPSPHSPTEHFIRRVSDKLRFEQTPRDGYDEGDFSARSIPACCVEEDYLEKLVRKRRPRNPVRSILTDPTSGCHPEMSGPPNDTSTIRAAHGPVISQYDDSDFMPTSKEYWPIASENGSTGFNVKGRDLQRRERQKRRKFKIDGQKEFVPDLEGTVHWGSRPDETRFLVIC